MATQDTDLLLVQRGAVPYKETASDFATYILGQAEPFPDAVIFQGLWDQEDTAPSDPEVGYLWIWNGGDATLNDSDWTGINGDDITDNDRIYYNGTAFEIFAVGVGDSDAGFQDLGYTPATDKGTVTITDGVNADIPLVTVTNAGLMSPTDKTNLDNITASPGGVLSVSAGDGILVTGTAGAPVVSANFGAVASGNPVTVMPYDISMLAELPEPTP